MSLMGQSRPVRASNGSVHARYALNADVEINGPLPIDGAALHVIQAPKSLIRYELTDYEWAAIRPMLPNKARGVRRGTIDGPPRHLLGAAIRRTMARSAGLVWPMHHLLQSFRPVAKGRSVGADHGRTCAAQDAAVQMIDTSIVRVHQHAACIARNRRQSKGQSRGGLTSKIHAVVDTNGRRSATAYFRDQQLHTDASRLKQALTDLRGGIPATQRMLQAAAPAQRIAGSSQPVGEPGCIVPS
jgi:hypothetical protein